MAEQGSYANKISDYIKLTKIARILSCYLLINLVGSFFCNLYADNNLIYPINSPYSKSQVKKNILFSSFSQQPKHLDPARSYSSDEAIFTGLIYEPPYQYHYLLRPYVLDPLSANGDFKVEFINDKKDPNSIKYSIYTIKIKSGIYYQPHPALAKNREGEFIFTKLSSSYIAKLDSINDIDYKVSSKIKTNTRELIANDFIYGIKRLADPKVQSPIYSFMAKYIVGLDELNKKLLEHDKSINKLVVYKTYIDLNDFDIEGLKLVDKYTFQIKIKNRYPQFKYWLAMPFLSPIPWEADKFYSQKGFKEQNISLDTYPVGTGPFMLAENNPNRKMVLVKNPNYKHGFYPTKGMSEDKAAGLLDNAGKPLPFLDTIIFSLEKESIPIWNKFLQGYYDSAGISSDNFDQAIELANNKLGLTPEMKEKGIILQASIEPSTFYWGFNMFDPVVGGQGIENKKLRQAIAIAFDVEEYINIFRNGRGVVAHSPIPSILLNDQQKNDYNYVVYDSIDIKKDIKQAHKLLSEAGYPGGINNATGEKLIINFDAIGSGNPSEGALFNWMRKQFNKLNIELNIRATQYNRFQDKMQSGRAQMYMWGWNADYPDAENFLFLFLCTQSKVEHKGENASNYCNKEFDDLFAKMQSTDNLEQKTKYINMMVNILRDDTPWIFGLYNEEFILKHGWLDPRKPLTVGNNSLKYLSLDPLKRLDSQKEWNKPKTWPILLFLIIILLLITPVALSYYYKIHHPRLRIK